MTDGPALLAGLDVLLADPTRVAGKRIGLLANPASVTRGFVPARRALEPAGAEVRVLFGPEHGLLGEAQDMEPVGAGGGARGTRVVSLYGERFEELSPGPADLDGLDIVVCDLPDVGSRYYTFVWTTVLVAQASARAGIPVLVLDRPNPLGGLLLEGNLPEERLLSFVGLHPIPVRHGMTTGEIVRWANAERGIGAALDVVPLRLEGESRPAPRGRIGETPSWVLPSPNMPSRRTALVYAGACLFEGTNLSEGRGTTRPFELIGAPWLDPDQAADAGNALGLPGVVFRPHSFRPTFQKHAGVCCGGVQLHVTDERAFRPFETGLRLLKALRDLDPGRFRWRTEWYEYRDDVPAIDLLAGTGRFRALVDGGEPLDEWISTFAADLSRFATSRDRALLYPGGARPAVVQVVGAHESGKTTLALALVAALVARRVRVAAVKHTRHEHPTDSPGKDSERLAAAGAEPVLLVAGTRVARHDRLASPPRLAGLLADPAFAGADVVLVEGFREEAYPKIEVVRGATGREPVSLSDPSVFAVVTDVPTAHATAIPRFAPGDLTGILEALEGAAGLLEER